MEQNNDFEYINENSIDQDLLCPLCTEPFSAK